MGTKRRKICFIITSKVHYSRSKELLYELRRRGDVELQIVVSAGALLSKFSDTVEEMKTDGFHPDAEIIMTFSGGSVVAMAKTTGMGIIEFTNIFDLLQPDLIVIRGDRYEILSAAIAASYLNITIAHIEGGDLTGSIDESVRHAVTKLSHIHLTTNGDSYNRVIQMGENPDYVHNIGCLEFEAIDKNKVSVTNEIINYWGVGDDVDIEKPFIIVIQHPVTTEMEHNKKNAEETLYALHKLAIQSIWFWPNEDAGTEDIAKALREYRELNGENHIRFFKYLPTDQFLNLLGKSACIIGNSSAGIKECSYIGIPAVNIGTRQNGRLQGPNVVNVSYDRNKIANAVRKQIKNGKYSPSTIYYKQNTNVKAADILATAGLYIQKVFSRS